MEQVEFIIDEKETSFDKADLFDNDTDCPEKEVKVHLDKWLWAARFYKTRALSRAAIEKGLVTYNGKKVKPTIEIKLNDVIGVRLGKIKKYVMIKNLSTRRKSAEEANDLFEELSENIIESYNDNGYQKKCFNKSDSKRSSSIRYLRRNNEQKDKYNSFECCHDGA